MPRFCGSCGAQIADNAAFCSNCGTAVGHLSAPAYTAASAPAPAASASGLKDNVAGLLAYITIVPAIVFLVMEPYNRRPFVRFHSFQSIFFAVACLAASIVLSMMGTFMGPLASMVGPLLWIAEFAIWIILLLKANAGQMFKLPVIGDLAMKQAGNAPSQ